MSVSEAVEERFTNGDLSDLWTAEQEFPCLGHVMSIAVVNIGADMPVALSSWLVHSACSQRHLKMRMRNAIIKWNVDNRKNARNLPMVKGIFGSALVGIFIENKRYPRDQFHTFFDKLYCALETLTADEINLALKAAKLRSTRGRKNIKDWSDIDI